jgi:hypothetical protein
MKCVIFLEIILSFKVIILSVILQEQNLQSFVKVVVRKILLVNTFNKLMEIKIHSAQKLVCWIFFFGIKMKNSKRLIGLKYKTIGTTNELLIWNIKFVGKKTVLIIKNKNYLICNVKWLKSNKILSV